jgi:hypothetical protein
MDSPVGSRRYMMELARRFLLDRRPDGQAGAPGDDVPRLTTSALEKVPRPLMSRSRERILANLDEMYREAFDRAKAAGDQAQMATLDFAYRREQLYFEILLDIRDAMERRV